MFSLVRRRGRTRLRAGRTGRYVALVLTWAFSSLSWCFLVSGRDWSARSVHVGDSENRQNKAFTQDHPVKRILPDRSRQFMRNDKSPTEPTGEVTSMRNQAWLGERSRVTASGSSRSLFNRQAPGGSGESPQVELPTASTAPHVPSARHQLWMGQRASCTAMGSSHALMRRQGSAEGGADEAQVTDIELERNTETSSSFSKRDSPRNVERHKALWLGHRASCKATGSSRALHHREPGSLDRPLPKLRTVGAIAARLRAATTLASAANEGAARHAADAEALPLINPAVADTLLDAAAAAPRAQSDETNAALADAFLAAVSVRRANSFSRPRGGGSPARSGLARGCRGR